MTREGTTALCKWCPDGKRTKLLPSNADVPCGVCRKARLR